MKKVYLHGKLGKRFGKKWELAVHSPSEAIRAIDSNVDGFVDYILQESANKKNYYFLKKTPEKIKSTKELEDNLINKNQVSASINCEEIHIVPETYGGVVAAFFAGVFGAGTLAATVATSMVWGVVAQVAMNLLFKPPKTPERKGPTNTKSFLIAGARTRQAQGVAVPLGYGRLKIGATAISESRITKRLKESDVLESFTDVTFLDLLSEGPIAGPTNQHGALVFGENVAESVYLNNVQVKNTSQSSDGTFNYILNEDDEMPQFKNGESGDSSVLLDYVSSIVTYDQILYGVGPYEDGF